MKLKFFATFFIGLLILISCSGEKKQNQAEESEAAAKPMEMQPAPIAQTVRGSLEQALREFEQGNAEKGAELIRQSIALVYPEGNEPPLEESETEAEAQTEGEVAPVAQMVRGRIQEAMKKFEAGEAEEAVKLLQEALALIHPEE
jgi:predicted negative regulator of RcsB-dependent stress response